MKKVKLLLFFICVTCIYLCSCDTKNTQSDNSLENVEETELAPLVYEDIPLKEENPFVGLWIAKGIIADNQYYSFEEVSELADLYDTEWISFSKSGIWKEYKLDNYEHAYCLYQESTTLIKNDENGNYYSDKTSSDKTYIAVLMNDDINTCMVIDVEKTDDDTIIVYGNDIDFWFDDSTVEFTNQFGTSTTKCAYKGCNNYIASSGDTNCCVEHSNLCLECNKYIDSDAMYCIDCLNGAINSNSSNSSIFSDSMTRGEENALQRAYDYLEYQAFSYSGLIEQLEFEGFTNSEATFAVDNCGADWSKQAVLRAEQYLEYSSFSRSGLKEQLEFEGFTSSQAEYAVNQVY